MFAVIGRVSLLCPWPFFSIKMALTECVCVCGPWSDVTKSCCYVMGAWWPQQVPQGNTGKQFPRQLSVAAFSRNFRRNVRSRESQQQQQQQLTVGWPFLRHTEPKVSSLILQDKWGHWTLHVPKQSSDSSSIGYYYYYYETSQQNTCNWSCPAAQLKNAAYSR